MQLHDYPDQPEGRNEEVVDDGWRIVALVGSGIVVFFGPFMGVGLLLWIICLLVFLIMVGVLVA